jgi:hypothetical protein
MQNRLAQKKGSSSTTVTPLGRWVPPRKRWQHFVADPARVNAAERRPLEDPALGERGEDRGVEMRAIDNPARLTTAGDGILPKIGSSSASGPRRSLMKAASSALRPDIALLKK